MLFGNLFSQFGWGFALFGTLFVFAFDPGGVIVEGIGFRGEVAVVEGVSTGWESTSLSIGNQRVYRTTFDYEVGGVMYSGASHETGAWIEAGSPIIVEYKPSDPALARIAGSRVSAGDPTLLFIFIFPIVGLGMASFTLVRGLRIRSLLVNGAVAYGRLLTKEPTSTVVNNQRVMRLTFEFQAEGGGTYHAIARSHQEHRLEDEEHELLVYDSRNPQRAELLDQLPSEPRFSELGEVEVSALGLPTPLYVLLPGVCTLVILRYLASLF